MEIRLRMRSSKLGTLLLLGVFLVTCASCATSFDKRGKYHSLRKGQDFWTVARVYRVDPQRLAEYNDIEDPHAMAPGTKLYIPPSEKKAGYKKLPIGTGRSKKRGRSYARRSKRRGSRPQYSRRIKTNHNRFLWPVKGKLSSRYGIRNGRRHDGIDISAPKNTPIRAGDRGRVVYSGKLRGYGKIVILKHKDGLFTVYAHNNKNLVKKNQRVKKGQTIAKVGRTGRSTGNHVHFEVRKGQTARNPLFFLPKKRRTKATARR